MGVSLDKKIEQLEQTGQTELVSLVKASAVSLKKTNLQDGHIAKVALCLDVSASMGHLFRNGTVTELVRKSLAQGIVFDDDGQIDVFTFGESARYEGEVGADTFASFTGDLKNFRLQGATYYDKAIKLVQRHYEDDNDGYPVYVIFITDGEPTDKAAARQAIRDASGKGIFFQFVGIGKGDFFPQHEDKQEADTGKKKGFFASLFGGGSESKPAQGRSGFDFLEELDDLDGRVLDNAGFFALRSPANTPNDKFYDLLMGEYPQWLPHARQANLIH